MKRFQISGLTFTLTANEPDLEQQLDQMFCLCKKSDKSTDILIEANIKHTKKANSTGPEWLFEKLDVLATPEGLVSMFWGPVGEPAAAVISRNHITCAWIPESKKEIQIIVCERRDPAIGKKKCSSYHNNVNSEKHLSLPKESRELITSSIQSVLPAILREIFLEKQKKFLIHSAALKCPDGTGVLLIADGGCGKTTTALSLLRRGARLLGDDLILLEINGDRVIAAGFPEMLNLTEQTISFFKELHDIQSCITHGRTSHKKVVSPYEIYGANCMIDRFEIDVIYFINVDGEIPSARQLTFGDAIGRLMHSQTFANHQKLDQFGFNTLSDILEHINAYDLFTGNSPEYIGEWLIEQCADHAKRYAA